MDKAIQPLKLDPDVNFIRHIRGSGGDALKKCYQCATCSVVCNLAPADRPFPRREMILAQWGLKDELLADPNIWLCHQCNDCSTKCPRQVRPGDVLAAVRTFAFEHFAYPSFMGKALSRATALPILFLIPALVLFGVLYFGSQGNLAYLWELQGEVDYARAFPHGILEMLFMGGNLLIFAFTAVGLMRFWKNLKSESAAGPGKVFIPAMIETALELISHQRFSKCDESKPRYLGHFLMLYGFVGAMATAGLALFATVILKELGSPFYLESPIDLPNPIKILGVASGLAMLIGGWLLIRQRLTQKPEISGNSYNDWLFLSVIVSVGLSGMFTYLLRLAGIPLIGYLVYYIHLILVFFLLWYAPYSKFAHMFYRALALTYAKSRGQDLPRVGRAA